MKRPKVVRLFRTESQELKRLFIKSERADRKLAHKLLKFLNQNPPVVEFIKSVAQGKSMQEAYQNIFIDEKETRP